MAARRKPLDMKGLRNEFSRDLALEERTSRSRPGALNSGNEQQSELEPSARPKQPAAPRRAAPPSSRKASPTIPYKRPGPGPIPPKRPPGEPPGPGPTQPGISPRQEPLVMPQYDPMGGVTGQQAPPAPGSSTQGWMQPGPSPIPPLTGPNSDRMAGNAPGTDPGEAWRNAVMANNPAPLPVGQSAAGAVLSGIQDRFNNPQANALPPPAPNVLGAPVPPPPGPPGIGQGPPQTGPGSDRAPPPPGMLGGLGSLPEGQSAMSQGWDALKRYLPPLGGM